MATEMHLMRDLNLKAGLSFSSGSVFSDSDNVTHVKRHLENFELDGDHLAQQNISTIKENESRWPDLFS